MATASERTYTGTALRTPAPGDSTGPSLDRLNELFQRHDRDVGHSRPGSRQHRQADAHPVRGIDRSFKRGEFVTPSEKAKAAAAQMALTSSAAMA